MRLVKKNIPYSLLLATLLLLTGVAKAQSTDEKLAIMFFQDKDYEKAAAIYERLYDERPGYNYYTYLFYCYSELNDLKRAEKIVRRQMKQEPASPRYKVDLGFIYSRQNEPAKAEKIYKEVLEDLPADRNLIVDAANAFQIRREAEYAIQVYQKGKALLNGTYPFSIEISYIYQAAGDINGMTEELLNYIDFDMTKVNVVQDRMQDALSNDTDGSKHDIFRKALLRRIQKFPDRTYYSEIMIWYSVQQRDFDLALTQAKSLDRRLNEDGRRVYEIARFCVTNEAWDVAVEAYRFVINRGKENPYYLPSRIELLNAYYLKITGNYAHITPDLADLEREYTTTLTELGHGVATITLMRNLAHLDAFYLDKAAPAIALLEEALVMPGTTPQQKAECKIELGDIYVFTGEVWEATLLYSQVDKAFKNDPLGYLAKLKNAKLSFYIGEFNWAKAQLDVLKAATERLICNDALELSLTIGDDLEEDTTGTALKIYSRAELLEFQNKDDQALALLDSISLSGTPTTLFDEVLYKKAEIHIKKGNYILADTLLGTVYYQYPKEVMADNALYLRAQLNEKQMNNKTRAMELYQDLLTLFPGSLYADDARKRFRILRGDNVNP
jgi:tetratricopeptide (TPR) repeat protein